MKSGSHKKHHWKTGNHLVYLGIYIEMLKENYFKVYGLKLVPFHYYFIWISFIASYYDALLAHLSILSHKFILAEFRSQSCCQQQIGDTKRKCSLEEESQTQELLLSFQFKTLFTYGESMEVNSAKQALHYVPDAKINLRFQLCLSTRHKSLKSCERFKESLSCLHIAGMRGAG